MSPRCVCGCGQPAPAYSRGPVNGRVHARYIVGHNRVHQGRPVSDRLCACGCGGLTMLADRTRPDRGWVA
ncbi:MAG: hypothetical protein ACRCZP_00905, partial [Phycicoccus sp.]